MKAAPSEKAGVQRLSPRKKPAQSRAAMTVEAILEGAAHVLEHRGFEGYTTNEIAARAGVSIGSLYQYFPNKDAVTIALIERETEGMVDEVLAALALSPPSRALQEAIRVSVGNQARRPQLARLLDFEELRLASLMPASRAGTVIREALVAFFRDRYGLSVPESEEAAVDVVEIAKALDYASARRGEVNAASLSRYIEAAVFGYLAAKLEDRAAPADHSTPSPSLRKLGSPRRLASRH
jgi:AcrR family transcriptional regulator